MNDSKLKVMIVNIQSMSEENATCITLRSLFSAWPKEDICEVSLSSNKSGDREFNSVLLDDSFFPFRKLFMSSFAKNANQKIKDKVLIEETEKICLKSKIRQLCYTICDMTPIVKKGVIIKSVKDFQPDVIYTVGCSVLTLKLALLFSKKLNKKIVMHFMDNWLESLEWNDNNLLRPYHFFLKLYAKKCYKRSNCALAISEKMAQQYTEKTGVKHYSIMNSIDVDKFWNTPKETLSSTINVTYAGGLHLNRWVSLKGIEEQLQKCSEKLNKNIIFNIYTSQQDKEKYQKYFFNKITVFHNYVEHEKITEVYRMSDVLIHVEALNSNLNEFFKYSISTKIPEYLASGRPIILLCPKEVALYDYLKSNNCAYVADSADEIFDCFETILTNKVETEKKINNANLIARKNHDIYRCQEKIKNVFEM